MTSFPRAAAFGRRLAAVAGLIAVALASAVAAPADPAAALAALADRYQTGMAQRDPVHAGTLVGDNRFDDRLVITIAPAERRARFDFLRRTQRALAAIDRRALPEADAATYDVLAHELQARLAFEPFPDHLLPLHQLDSLPLVLAKFGSGQAEQPLVSARDHAAYLARLARLPAWTDQAIANLREGLRRGVVAPQAVVAATLKPLKALADPALDTNPFYAPMRQAAGALTAAERERLASAYAATVTRRVAPAMRRLVHFVETTYLPGARTSAGWGALPDGAAWYRQWVRDQTTTELTPEAIHTLGLQEVARLHGELARVAPQLGYEGDPRTLLAWARTSERFRPFRSEAEILDAYRALNERVKPRLPALFGRAPKAPLDIRPEPELTRATASDHYALPAADGSRPGLFWAVINDPKDYDASTMTALFLHEGQPGHHFQMALQQEMALPRLRRHLWINAFGEGWALYAETLGDEMGLYADPVARVGQLRLEMLRAARLVVDTGLHAKGWTREQAIAYWLDNVGSSETQAANQIHRYMAWPGQALGYKVGSLQIQALRRRAEAALGPRFDLAAFHDAVLGAGALPLSVLERRIEAWLAAQQVSPGK